MKEGKERKNNSWYSRQATIGCDQQFDDVRGREKKKDGMETGESRKERMLKSDDTFTIWTIGREVLGWQWASD